MSLTVKNPANPSQTYTFGSRGKRPAFVTEGLANGTIKIPYEYETKQATVKTNKEPTQKAIDLETGLKAWKWVGVEDLDPRLNNCPVRCVVVANDIREAIMTLNKTMTNAVTKYEFVNFWKQINKEEFDMREKVAAYEFKDNLWVQRKEKHAPLVLA
jgi:hypothetical protein